MQGKVKRVRDELGGVEEEEVRDGLMRELQGEYDKYVKLY